MRKNQRWASASFSSYPYPSAKANGLGSSAGKRGGEEKGRVEANAGLMSGFMALKMELRETEGTSCYPLACTGTNADLVAPDVANLDALVLLHPFLEVVRSPETSGPITATALSSIDKFITYSILHPGSPNLALAMAQLSTAGTHCKFEASDSVSDEVVLLKILDVLRNTLTGRLGEVLSDESVCEMMETGLSMCCQMRLSGALSLAPARTFEANPSTHAQKCFVDQQNERCTPWSLQSSPTSATSPPSKASPSTSSPRPSPSRDRFRRTSRETLSAWEYG